MSEQIHWHEGLFLRPHHLQMMQRQVLGRVAAERRLAQSYPYGVVNTKLSFDALENNLVRFDRLHAVMPSGTEVDFPATADLPPLDIKQAFEAGGQSFTVYLGVPLWYPTRGNAFEADTADSWRMKRHYRVAEVQRIDENTGENTQPVLVRRLNARLMLDDDDRTDMEVLPLLRIAHAAGKDLGLPRQDPAFIPPCLFLGGSLVLRDLVRDLADQVEASRKELVVQVTRGGFSVDTMRGRQFEQVLRLQTLNRFSARLPHLAKAPATTPFEIYLELRQLLGELAALRPEQDAFEVADYDHDNPALAFGELHAGIRPFLRGTVHDTTMQVPFVREGRIWAANLTDEHLTLPNQYFLGIKSGQDPRQVAALVENADDFKLMPKSLIRQQIWGVRLAEERHPPTELPAQVGLNYYRLLRDRSAMMWEQATRDKALAIRWSGLETSDFNITLYMTVPTPTQ